MQKITLKFISSLNPCYDPTEIGFEKEMELTPVQFIEQFRNKVNMGRMEKPDWVSEHTGSCGDTLQIYLKINNGVIEDAKFLYEGCPGVVPRICNNRDGEEESP